MPSSKRLIGRFAEGEAHGDFHLDRNSSGAMAHLYRLVVLAFVLLCGSAPASATIPVGTQFTVCVGGFCGEASPTGVLACKSAVPAFNAFNPLNTFTYVGQGPNNAAACVMSYVVKSSGATGGTTSGTLTSVSASCPSHSTASGSVCQCNVGYSESGGVCVDTGVVECSALAGKPAGSKNWEGEAQTFSFCDGYNGAGGGKCIVTAQKTLQWEDPPNSGHYISQGSGTYTGGKGTSCNGSGGTGDTPAPSSPKDADGNPPIKPNPGEAAPAPCPQGQQPGEVNGTRVCAPIGPETPIKATDTKQITNPDGSKQTETSESRCADGKCQTDTTVCKQPAGSTNQTCETTTTAQSQTSLCASNKGSNACTGDRDGTGSDFSGDCVAGFKAEGDDAVLNAMALDQHKRHCEMLRTDQPESLAYESLKDAAGTSKATNPNDSTVTIGPGNFDQSDALGGGGCNLNKTISVAGRSVVLPFNVLCDPLAVLGQLLVAISLLLAARIVTRG